MSDYRVTPFVYDRDLERVLNEPGWDLLEMFRNAPGADRLETTTVIQVRGIGYHVERALHERCVMAN
jgi:hypothetical protein